MVDGVHGGGVAGVEGLADARSDVVLVLDGHGRVTGCSPNAVRVLGVDSAWFIGRAPSECFEVVDPTIDRCALLAPRARRRPVEVVEVGHGEARWLLVSDRRHVARLEAALQEMAGVDALTGLLSHERLLAVLHRELARAQRYHRPLALARVEVLELDTLTPSMRDAAVDLVARHLEGLLRGADQLGRMHDGSFVFVLPETEHAGVTRLGERLEEGAAEMQLTLGERAWRPSIQVTTTTLRAGDQRLDLERRLWPVAEAMAS